MKTLETTRHEAIGRSQGLLGAFLNRVVPRAELIETATALAEKIAANGPIAVKAVLRSARECLGLTEAEGMRVEAGHAGPVFQSEDAVEGPRAFLEKRAPCFARASAP